MFNAKSLLDALINAGSQAGTQAGQQGGLGGMLGGLADQVQRSGGIGGLAGQILTQATQGLGDAARQTGVQQGAGEALGRVTGGRTPDQLIEQAKGMFTSNPALATAVLGGLGALVFGTSTGRSVAMCGGEGLGEGIGFRVDDEIDVALPVERHLLRAVAGNLGEAHRLEESAELLRFGMGVFDELETIRAHRVGGRDRRRGGIVRKRTHGHSSCLLLSG